MDKIMKDKEQGAGWRQFVSGRLPSFVSPGLSLVDQAIVSASNFLSILILARSMPAAAFGAFMLAHTVLMLLTSLQNALVTQPHNVLGVIKVGREYQQFTRSLAIVQLIACISFSSLFAVAGIVIGSVYSPDTGIIVLALAAAAIPWMGQEFVRRVLFTRSESAAATLNDIVSYGLQLAGIVGLAYFHSQLSPSPQAALLIFGGSSLVAVLLGIWQLRKYLFFPAGGNHLEEVKRAWSDAWVFGKWLVSQQAMTWFGVSGHGWILAAILGPEKFGMYRAAYQIVNVLNPFRQAAMNYLPSRASQALASEGIAGLKQWSERTTRILSIPFLLGVLILVLFAQPLLSIVYGDKYAGLGLQWVIILGALAYLLNFVRVPKEFAVLAMGATKALFFRTAFCTVLALTMGILLIYQFGIPGALCSELGIAAASLIVVQRIYSLQNALMNGASVDRNVTTSSSYAVALSHSRAQFGWGLGAKTRPCQRTPSRPPTGGA